MNNRKKLNSFKDNKNIHNAVLSPGQICCFGLTDAIPCQFSLKTSQNLNQNEFAQPLLGNLVEAMHVFVRRSYKHHSAALGPMWIICATVPLSMISLKAPKACKLLYDLGL